MTFHLAIAFMELVSFVAIRTVLLAVVLSNLDSSLSCKAVAVIHSKPKSVSSDAKEHLSLEYDCLTVLDTCLTSFYLDCDALLFV